MIDLPQWLENKINEIECPNCGRNIGPETVVGVGIREQEEDGKNNSYLVIENTCNYCGKTYGFDVTNCNVREFVFDMIEKYGLIDTSSIEDTEPVGIEMGKNSEESAGISQREIDTFKLMMKDCDNWTDLMKCVGINKEDRERYIKDSEKDK